MWNSWTFSTKFGDFLFRVVFLAVLKIGKTRVAGDVFSLFSLLFVFGMLVKK